MASTPVKFIRAYDTSLTAKLVSVGGTGTPNASGYGCTNTNGMQSFTVAEALIGLFYAYAYDAAGEIAWQGYFDLLNDTETYYGFDDLATLVQAKSALAQSQANNAILATYAAPIATAAAESAAAAASAATAVSQTTPAAIRDSVNADGLDLQESLRVLLAVMAGKLSKPTALERVFRAIDDSKARVTATMDAQSNRVTITIDAS